MGASSARSPISKKTIGARHTILARGKKKKTNTAEGAYIPIKNKSGGRKGPTGKVREGCEYVLAQITAMSGKENMGFANPKASDSKPNRKEH